MKNTITVLDITLLWHGSIQEYISNGSACQYAAIRTKAGKWYAGYYNDNEVFADMAPGTFDTPEEAAEEAIKFFA